MVLAYHLVLTAYGFLLPNDPRGSYSDFVRSFDLYHAAGKATKVSTHRSVANEPHDHTARQRAKQSLAYPPVAFIGQQARAVAQGFADYCTRNRNSCNALHAANKPPSVPISHKNASAAASSLPWRA